MGKETRYRYQYQHRYQYRYRCRYQGQYWYWYQDRYCYWYRYWQPHWPDMADVEQAVRGLNWIRLDRFGLDWIVWDCIELV